MDHQAFQREFAAAWSAVSESQDSQGKHLAYQIQSELSRFVEDLVSESALKGKLARLALPPQLYTTTVKVTFRREEELPGQTGSWNLFEETSQSLSSNQSQDIAMFARS
jgi:hypothetical protein